MSILANDFKALWRDIADDALSAVRRVGESGWYVLGEEVRTFEAELAAFHGVEHAVGVASGLDAIEIGLRAAGIGDGSVVLTTPLTAFATALAILRAGATPRFVDTDEQGLLDLEAVQRILAAGERVDAIVPVHLYGQVVDVPRLETLAGTYGFAILEDAAQAIGARLGDRPVGATTLGAATSFYPTKNLGALGDGGALLTNDAAIAESARQLRDYGQRAKYEHVVPGLNSRLDELHAAVLRSAMLPRLGAALERRGAIANAYLDGIDHREIRLPEPAAPSTWHLFPVFAPDADRRDALQQHLREAGIQTGVHYPILASAQQAVPAPEPGTTYPVAQRLAETELSLPIHPYLPNDQVAAVIAACNAW